MANSRDRALWLLARSFASLRARIERSTGLHLKGVGLLLRRLRSDFEFAACGFRWHLDHRIADTYASLAAKEFSEPETITFLQAVAARSPTPLTFVDVGANIGQMVVVMAAHGNVQRVVAFEPHPVCADVCRRNLSLNGLQGDVRQSVVSNGEPAAFIIGEHSQESGIQRASVDAPMVNTVRLDDALDVAGPVVLLIDVEGAELDVLSGAAQFIARNQPLIIFEYHEATKQRFSLEEVRHLLGEKYEIMRLRSDGQLDSQLEKTWNCVALHRESSLYDAAQGSFSTARK